MPAPAALVTFGCLAAIRPAVAAAAEAGLYDIRGPFPVDGTPPFALTGGVLLLAGVLVALARRRSGAFEAPPPAPPTPAPTLPARFAALSERYRRKDCSGGQAVAQLDALLRELLATVSGFPTRCRTSAELLGTLVPVLGESIAADRQDAGAWTRLFALGDRVKFAGHQPSSAEVDDALAAASRLIEALSAGAAR